MKKQLLLLGMMLLPMVAIADYSGRCGYNVNYTYVESTHTLTISGTGDMDNYMIRSVPWKKYKEEIVDAIIEDGVTSIGGGAFNNCTGLKSITIGDSVSYIGPDAFYKCSSLPSVTIPPSVTRIGDRAFYDCSALRSVHISDLKAWCNIYFDNNPLCYAHHLYMNGSEITDLVIPDSVTTIGKMAFEGCTGLVSVTIPNGVIGIGDYALCGCSGLTSVTFPNSMKTIGGDAFGHCTRLTSITIPDSVTTIANHAFYACPLTHVTIPNSVTSIGDFAFCESRSLESVILGSGVTSMGTGIFYECYGLSVVVSLIESPFDITVNTFYNYGAKLYVPVGTIEKYKAAEGWKRFFNIEEGNESGIAEVKAMPVQIRKYDGVLNLSGAPEGADISVYDTGGKILGSSTAINGNANIAIPQTDKIAIVKIGNKAVKVSLK